MSILMRKFVEAAYRDVEDRLAARRALAPPVVSETSDIPVTAEGFARWCLARPLDPHGLGDIPSRPYQSPPPLFEADQP